MHCFSVLTQTRTMQIYNYVGTIYFTVRRVLPHHLLTVFLFFKLTYRYPRIDAPDSFTSFCSKQNAENSQKINKNERDHSSSPRSWYLSTHFLFLFLSNLFAYNLSQALLISKSHWPFHCSHFLFNVSINRNRTSEFRCRMLFLHVSAYFVSFCQDLV